MLSVAFAAVRLGVLEILRTFSRTPNLHISKRFARATGVGLGEREMHLRRDAPATKSSGPPTSNARSFAKQSRKRVCANCETYPPTVGRCRKAVARVVPQGPERKQSYFIHTHIRRMQQ